MRRGKDRRLVRLGCYYIYLLLVWGGFRYWVRLPEVIEELWFKPVIWLLPWFWWRLSMEGRPSLFAGRWWRSGLWGVVFGGGYFVLLRFLGKGWWRIDGDLDVLGIAWTTAMVEELTFSGLVLGLLDEVRGRNMVNLIVVGLMVMMVHLPVNLFVFDLRTRELIGVSTWLFSVAIINGWLRRKTENVTSSIIARFMLMLAVL